MASAPRTASRAPSTTSSPVKSTMNGMVNRSRTSRRVGTRTSPCPISRTCARSRSPTARSIPQRRSKVGSCSTTITPSRVRRRSSSTMSAPWCTAASNAGIVFSRWPTGSPRWAMAMVTTVPLGVFPWLHRRRPRHRGRGGRRREPAGRSGAVGQLEERRHECLRPPGCERRRRPS